jgi:hypothetical protein
MPVSVSRVLLSFLSEKKQKTDTMVLNPSNNISDLYGLISVGATLNDLQIEELGRVKDYPLIFLTPKNPDPSKKNVLIAAGFHGNEIAGPWGIANWLMSEKENKVNASFLPLVNPTGFLAGSAKNSDGGYPNDGWIHEGELSAEGKLIMFNMGKILPAAADGFLTLHEDHTNDQFYLYYFSDNDTIPDKVDEILSIGQTYFGIVRDGNYKDTPIKNGLVKNLHDGTFEDFLYHRSVPLSVCTETPGNGDPLKRVAATSSIIESFTS